MDQFADELSGVFQALAVVDGWLSAQRAVWEGRTDRLEQLVTTAPEEETPK